MIDTSDISDLLLKVIANKTHLTTKLIKNTSKSLSTFSFDYADESDIEKKIMDLNNSKSFLDSDILVKIMKDNLDIFKKMYISGIK